MEFIASFWLLWAIMLVVGFGLAIKNQLRRMKGIMKGSAFGDSEDAFFNGLGTMFIWAGIGSLGGLLLLIAIVKNLMGA